MLNKELCLKCHHAVIAWLRDKNKNPEKLLKHFHKEWERGKVFCFYQWAENETKSISIRKRSIPDVCPYLVEQTVCQGVRDA